MKQKKQIKAIVRQLDKIIEENKDFPSIVSGFRFSRAELLSYREALKWVLG